MRIRPERVGHRMRRELAEILANELRDPRLGAMLSVTDVEVTPDLSSAKVFVSVLAEGAERDRVLEGLERASGFIRRTLGPRLGLREVPELHFRIDRSIEQGARVEDLLKRLERGEIVEDEETP